MAEFPRAQEGWIPVVIIQGDEPISLSNQLEVVSSATVTSENETFLGGGHRANFAYTPIKIINGDEEVSSSNQLPVRFV